MNILVVGGAGYIGSHCVRQLVQAGHRTVIVDNLSYGNRGSLPENITFYEENLGNKEVMITLLQKENIDIVMHFAGYINVGESVHNPLKYYQNNVAATINLLEAMQEAQVNKFVFSSTCAIYGNTEQLPLKENTPTQPLNPYGQNKLDIELLLRYLAKSSGLSSAVLRYFNAAGAHSSGEIGEDHRPETHLIPLAIQAATGQNEKLSLFGDDYPTPDGTCLRDYIHVDDLCRAHLAAFSQLDELGSFVDYNLGTGTPTSVKQIIETVEQVTGLKVPYIIKPRREGDAIALYADNTKAVQDLNWQPLSSDIKTIIQTAWNWHSENPEGFKGLL